MSAITDLSRWLRTDFAEINTFLEEAYFVERAEILYDVVDLEQRKHALRDAGAALIGRLGTDVSYELLGAVGLYLAACRRHEIDAPEHAQTVAGRLGLALGVAPRYVFAHLGTHNPAGHAFTHLPDEHTFTTYNALGVLAYQRAAAALRGIAGTDIDGPLAAHLLDEARDALDDVLRFNRALAAELDRDRFFYSVRPYFKPHVVCGAEYRGVNAGDFAAVNEIDLALGLCDMADPFYQRVLAEKYPYVPPADQPALRSLPTSLLSKIEPSSANVEGFLAVCRAHGAAYAFHHHRLVRPFLVEPAETVPPDRLAKLTASGPPLDVVVAGLARLVDLRAARDRPGTAHGRLAELRRKSMSTV
jgi:hypothetical protein